jgi:streptomycin 6-kinase
MMDVSFKHESGEKVDGVTLAAGAVADQMLGNKKKNRAASQSGTASQSGSDKGMTEMAFGTLSVTIHEEQDARDERDKAIEAARAALEVAEKMRATEEKLRTKLAESSAAFHKERSERTSERLAHAKEVAEHKEIIKQLTAENEKLKKKVFVWAGLLAATKPRDLARRKTRLAKSKQPKKKKLTRVPGSSFQ